jgi:hypothetical protein
LQPGEACYAQIYFGPNEAVDFAAQFSVNVDSYSFSADLSGTGGRATFKPAANVTDFGVAKVGSSRTREVRITNTGNMPGGMFIAVIAGGAIGSFQILDENCTNVELVPAATCTLQVRFAPVSEGAKKATLGLFGESDGASPISLTGVGSAPDPLETQPSNTVVTVQSTVSPKAKSRKRQHRHYQRHSRKAAIASARISTRRPR